MARRNPSLVKLTPPSLPRILDRPRLFRLLDGARKRPVTWITAPPGSGKTTLVAGYVRAKGLPVLWYQLDSGDADPAAFFHYLGLASRRASPRFRTPLPHLTPEYLPGLQTFSRRFFEEVFARLKTPAVVVFDNYQDVPDDALFHDLIQDGLGAIPHKVAVVVLSRQAPHPALGRLQASRMVSLIEEDALRLNPAELKQLAAIQFRRHATPSRQELERLHERTQGWFAGAVLYMDPHTRPTSLVEPQQGEPHEVLFNYLASETMKDLDADTQTVLLKTSVLPNPSVAAARELSGVDRAGEILARLHRARYFTERRSDPEPTYQYHPLFREFLQARAANVFPPEELRALRATAGRLLEESGQLEEAGALYREAGQFDGLVRLTLTHAPVLLGQGRSTLIEQWISQLPPAVVEQTPWLLYWRATCRLPVSPDEAQPLYVRAFDQFRRQGDRAGSLLAWCGVVDAIWYAWQDLPQMDQWIDRFSTLMPEGEPYPSPQVEAAVACAMFVALFWRRPTFATITPWATKVATLLENVPALTVQLATTGLALVNYFVQLGEAGKAERLLRSMDNALRRSPSAPFVQIAREQANAVLAHCLGEPERGAQSVATGLEIAQRCGIFLWNLPLCGAGCMFAFLTGDLVTAQRYVDQMLLQPLECVQTFRSWALCLESALAFETRDLPRALRAGEASLALTTREGPWPEALSRLDLAMTLHALGRDDEADAHLARLAAIAADMKSRQLEFDYLTLAALFAFDRHDDEEGSRQLRAAFELASAKAIMGWQVGVARDGLARLCAKALDAGIETDFVRRIIATRKLTPDATAANLESWPWPVRVYTFGRFALVKGRKPVAFRGKTQKRPLDLLKALIALGGREVSEARIIEALWPEAEGDAAYYALNMALKRLRELLGQPDAVLLTDRKLTLNPRICWVDAWAFERGLGQPATDHKTIETALGLCKGRFLGTDEAPWGISLRERLHAKFLSGVRSLGGKLEERHQWSEAVAWYQRALHVDDLVEEFYQRLMLCHDRLGQRGTALSTYQRCKRALATRLSVHPSAQTNEIYRRLASLEN